MRISKRVLLPQSIEREAMEMIEHAGHEVVLSPDPKPDTVIPLLNDVEGLILRTGFAVTREALTHAPNLLIISRTGMGLDNVDVEAATEKEVVVTSNMGVNTSSVVEHALALMLAVSKQLLVLDREVRQNHFAVRYQNLPSDLNGKTLGLIGFGRIGSTFARTCHRSFQMKILAFDPLLPQEAMDAYHDWVDFVDLKELLSHSDFVSLHVPLTQNTRNLIDKEALSRMKPDAILINTSRGGIIHESDLAEAIQKKEIRGAGLDVFSHEPPDGDHPLLKQREVVLTPHTAALTKECVLRMATEAAQCVLDLFNGVEPQNVANRDVLKSKRWAHLKRLESMPSA